MISSERYRLAEGRDVGRIARFRNSAVDEPVFGVYQGGSGHKQVCEFDDGSMRTFSTAEVPDGRQW